MSTDEAVHLPLTVADTNDHPPAAAFLSLDGPKDLFLLPKWVHIKDRNGRYLSVRSSPEWATLTFRTGDPDLNCTWEAIEAGNAYRFFGQNGSHIGRYKGPPGYPDWYSGHGAVNPSYFVITSPGGRVYLKDDYTPSGFISDELTSAGAPVAHDYINESSHFEIVQAAASNEILNVKYDILGGKVRDAPPLVALSTSVRNDSDGPVNQTLSYTYEKWSAGTWNNIAGVEIGWKSTFSAGVPFVAGAQAEISVSGSYSHQWGGEEGKREIITSSTSVTVPPKKKAQATIIVRNAQLDVGFTYTQNTLWTNGQRQQEEKKGIYRNVDSWHVDVKLDNWQDA